MNSKLTLIKIIGNNKYGQSIGLYKCECGNEKELRVYSVKNGNTKSCGCFHKKQLIERSITHGLADHPLYGVWMGIKGRCYNSNHSAYKYYGGKNVKMCQEWKDDFLAFYNWAIENNWKEGLQIDKDIKAKQKGIASLLYSPEWCTIVTAKQNSNAKEGCNVYKIDNLNYTKAQLSEKYDINYAALNRRLKVGWGVEKSLGVPLIKAKGIEYNGVSKSISDWAKAIGMTATGLRTRLNKNNWDIQKSLESPLMINQFKKKPIEIRYSFGHFK